MPAVIFQGTPLDEKEVKHINCSNCTAPLYVYFVRPIENPKTYRVNANCPFCGDKAFEIKITGKVQFGSTEYVNATPRAVFKERKSLQEPLEATDYINIQTDIRKKWSKK